MKSSIRRTLNNLKSDRLYSIIIRLLIIISGSKVNLKINKNNSSVAIDSFYLIPSIRRVPFYIHGLSYRGDRLSEEYLLNEISFEDGDLIVDCGANSGDLLLALNKTNKKLEYVGFEPGPKEFGCAQKNIEAFKKIQGTLVNAALGNKNDKICFFEDTDKGDSSVFTPRSGKDFIEVDCFRLDSYFKQSKRIKLFKLEAEGYEPEILEGASNILKDIEYITVDVGFERGAKNESTLPEVSNFLIKLGFEIISNGRQRNILLFKNMETKQI